MWFRVDDKFHDHPKVQLLLERGHGSALSLWALTGSWSGDQLSDGVISKWALGRWGPEFLEFAEQLADVGLFDRTEVEGRPHYVLHDFLTRNDSREKILADRAYETRRVALMRDGALCAAIKKRDRNRCRYCGSLVRWGDQRSPQGATYDHVDPDGPNTINNVVIACRGCNGRKKGLTLREAGMRKLPAGSMGAPSEEDRNSGRTQYDPDAGDQRPGSGRVGSGPQNVLSTDSEPEAPATPPAGGAR